MLKNSQKLIKQTSVKNKLGMHARPASKIAQIAESANHEVWICANDQKIDATSIIDILTLCAVQGTNITVEIENELDSSVLHDIVQFFESGFGEN